MDALGMVEVNSVAVGVEAADAMLKAANVQLLNTQPVCPGKYMILIRGRVAEVKSSIETGAKVARHTLVDKFVIANIHSQVFPALTATSHIKGLNSIGIIETFSLAACVLAADTAVKASEIELIEIRLGTGLGGKSFVILTGDVSAVKHSVSVVKEKYSEGGSLVSSVVIPSPHIDLTQGIL